MRFSKFIVAGIIILNILFTVAVLIVVVKTSVEPTSLIVAWFSFTTVELWATASIKKTETKHTKPPDDPGNNS